MELPLLLVNFKAYSESTNVNAMKIAKACKVVSYKTECTIAVAPSFLDIHHLRKFEIPIFAQHIDPVSPGAHTGSITAEAVRCAGCVGTIINHAEKQLDPQSIKICIERAKSNRLITVCCADSALSAKEVAKFAPDFISYEPPELIGSGIPVSKAKADVVTDVVKIVQNINPRIKVLCGAGITNGEDVRRAIELGTKGVLLASAVTKALNPRHVLEDLVSGFR